VVLRNPTVADITNADAARAPDVGFSETVAWVE
jgi:hypothetical protein